MMKYLMIDIEKPVQFLGAGHFISQGDWIHPCRSQDNTEIIIGCQGTAYLQHGKHQYELKPNEMITFLPDVEHKGYQVSTEQVAFYWFHIIGETEIISKEQADNEFYKMNSGIYNHQISKTFIPMYGDFPSTHSVGILFNQLLHIYKEKYYSKAARDYAVTMLLLELNQLSYRKWLAEGSNQTERKLVKIMEWIKANSDESISYESVANRFNYNKNYLNRYFKSKTGITINHYIHIERIKKAKELLYRSNKTIKEIAFSVGYEDEKYFLKIFKKNEGITPSQYRNIYYNTRINSK